MTIVLYLLPYTKIKSKWINDLKVRDKPIKWFEENIGERIVTLDLAGNNILDMVPKIQAATTK